MTSDPNPPVADLPEGRWVQALPALRGREFWLLQAAVGVIATTHFFVVAARYDVAGLASQLLTTLLILPVVYAALVFGRSGYVPTAVWCAIASVPCTVLNHVGEEQWREALEVATIVVLAAFVGSRVDHEKQARLNAERREIERRTSEEKYRGVFDQVVEPILLLDEEGVVQEANRSAWDVFGSSQHGPVGRSITELLGGELSDLADVPRAGGVQPIRIRGRAGPIWIEPVLIPFVAMGGARRIQLMLRDVTSRYVRQQELEAYTRETIAAPEAERRRIARELHDGPVQSLVLLWRKLDQLGSVAGTDRESLVQEAQADARSIGDELRRLSRDLRPSILDDLGLSAALKAEIASFAARSGILARFDVSGSERRVSSDIELALFRIAQEALRNIEQHSAAGNVLVGLAYEPTDVTVTIADDGSGLGTIPPTTDLLAQGRFGLVGMQERARLADADFRIQSGPGPGTTVVVRAPA